MSLSGYLSIAQRSAGYRTHGSVQGYVGWGFEKPALVGGVPAQSREVATRWSFSCFPNQWWFYDSMKYTILKGSTDVNELKFTDQGTAIYGICMYVNYKYNCQQNLYHALDLVKSIFLLMLNWRLSQLSHLSILKI